MTIEATNLTGYGRFGPGTILEDSDEDRWCVMPDGSVQMPDGTVCDSVNGLDADFGPLKVVQSPGHYARDYTTSAGGTNMGKMHDPNVALLGRAGAGKDTVASLLVDRGDHVRVAFADPLKKMALAVDPVIPGWTMVGDDGSFDNPMRLSDVVETDGWDAAKRDYPEVRRLLQRLGAEGVRDTIGEDTWIRLARRRIDEVHAAGKNVVLTDCRFPNEVEMARRLGFRLIWISRPGVADGAHTSESAVGPEDSDVVVVNDGSREKLYAGVRWALYNSKEGRARESSVTADCAEKIDWAKDSLPDPDLLMYTGTPNYGDYDRPSR